MLVTAAKLTLVSVPFSPRRTQSLIGVQKNGLGERRPLATTFSSVSLVDSEEGGFPLHAGANVNIPVLVYCFSIVSRIDWANDRAYFSSTVPAAGGQVSPQHRSCLSCCRSNCGCCTIKGVLVLDSSEALSNEV